VFYDGHVGFLKKNSVRDPNFEFWPKNSLKSAFSGTVMGQLHSSLGLTRNFEVNVKVVYLCNVTWAGGFISLSTMQGWHSVAHKICLCGLL